MPQRASRRFGRLIISTTDQAAEAPIFDGCGIHDADKRSYGGWAIRPQRTAGRALVIGWRGAMVPWSMSTRMRIWRYRFASRVAWPIVRAMLERLGSKGAPTCDGCRLPITGVPIYGGEDAPELCRFCAPATADATAPI